MRETTVSLSLHEIYMLSMALANDPNRPTLTQGQQVEVQNYLELTAKLQAARKRLE